MEGNIVENILNSFGVFDNATSIRAYLKRFLVEGSLTQEQATEIYRRWREKCETFKKECKPKQARRVFG